MGATGPSDGAQIPGVAQIPGDWTEFCADLGRGVTRPVTLTELDGAQIPGVAQIPVAVTAICAGLGRGVARP